MQVLVIARVATDQISSEKRAAHARVAAVTLVLAIARLDRASITSLSHLKHSTFSARSAHADFAALTYKFIFDIKKDY